MLAAALHENSPAALRYPRGAEGAFTDDTSGADACILREGTDCTIVSYGILINEALAASDALAAGGVSAEVLKLNRLDALDYACIAASAAKTRRLLVAEDTAAAGCVGIRIMAELERRGVMLNHVRLQNLGSGVVPHGCVPDLMRTLKLDAAGIAEICGELCR